MYGLECYSQNGMYVPTIDVIPFQLKGFYVGFQVVNYNNIE